MHRDKIVGNNLSGVVEMSRSKQFLGGSSRVFKKAFAADFEAKSLHQQQQQRLFHAVKALWAVEHKTFVDYILKETVEHLMLPRDAWIANALFTNEKIKQAAVEDPDMEKKRQELKDKLSVHG